MQRKKYHFKKLALEGQKQQYYLPFIQPKIALLKKPFFHLFIKILLYALNKLSQTALKKYLNQIHYTILG